MADVFSISCYKFATLYRIARSFAFSD